MNWKNRLSQIRVGDWVEVIIPAITDDGMNLHYNLGEKIRIEKVYAVGSYLSCKSKQAYNIVGHDYVIYREHIRKI